MRFSLSVLSGSGGISLFSRSVNSRLIQAFDLSGGRFAAPLSRSFGSGGIHAIVICLNRCGIQGGFWSTFLARNFAQELGTILYRNVTHNCLLYLFFLIRAAPPVASSKKIEQNLPTTVRPYHFNMNEDPARSDFLKFTINDTPLTRRVAHYGRLATGFL